MVWLLIIASHTGGPAVLVKDSTFTRLKDCTTAGRASERQYAYSGVMASSMCVEVRK